MDGHAAGVVVPWWLAVAGTVLLDTEDNQMTDHGLAMCP
jgi:hypothetical protein